jgi:hypothetical protein
MRVHNHDQGDIIETGMVFYKATTAAVKADAVAGAEPSKPSAPAPPRRRRRG